MGFTINGAAITDPTQFDKLISHKKGPLWLAPKPTLTNIDSDQYQPNHAFIVMDHECCTLNIHKHKNTPYLQLYYAAHATTIYFYNHEGQRALLTTQTAPSADIVKKLLAPFGNTQTIHMMIFGSSAINDNRHIKHHATKCILANLRAFYDFTKSNKQYHINISHAQVLENNTLNEENIYIHIISYLHDKLVRIHRIQQAADFNKKINYQNVHENFNHNTYDSDHVTNAINMLGITQLTIPVPPEDLPDIGAQDESYLDRLANILFSQAAINTIKEHWIRAGEPFLRAFAINCQTHHVMPVYRDHVDVNNHAIRLAHSLQMMDENQLRFFNADNGEQHPHFLFTPKFISYIKQHLPLLPVLRRSEIDSLREIGILNRKELPLEDQVIKLNQRVQDLRKIVDMAKLIHPTCPKDTISLLIFSLITSLEHYQHHPQAFKTLDHTTLTLYQNELKRILAQNECLFVDIHPTQQASLCIYSNISSDALVVENYLNHHKIKNTLGFDYYTRGFLITLPTTGLALIKLKLIKPIEQAVFSNENTEESVARYRP